MAKWTVGTDCPALAHCYYFLKLMESFGDAFGGIVGKSWQEEEPHRGQQSYNAWNSLQVILGLQRAMQGVSPPAAVLVT